MRWTVQGRFYAAIGGALCRLFRGGRYSSTVFPGLAAGQGPRPRRHRAGAGAAADGAHPGHSAGDADKPTVTMRCAPPSWSRAASRFWAMPRPGWPKAPPPSCGLCAGRARLHAGDAAGGDLCLQGPRRARPRLWAGAAVGLAVLHRGKFPGRLCRRPDSAAATDLADRGGERAQRGGRALSRAAGKSGAGGKRRAGRAASRCCATRPFSPWSWRQV